jgi:hypothetical protein
MKKILLFVFSMLFLVVGCDESENEVEVLGNCVIKGTTYINFIPFVRYECYENVYTKKECMDKTKQVSTINLTYNSYITESCSDFCADSPGTVCIEY